MSIQQKHLVTEEVYNAQQSLVSQHETVMEFSDDSVLCVIIRSDILIYQTCIHSCQEVIM